MIADHVTRRARRAPLPAFLVGGAIVLASAALSLFTILRHRNLWSDIFDLGLEIQVLWNTAHGRWFESSVEVHNYLGDHTTFITLLLAPVYWLFPHVETALILQALAYTIAAWPLFVASRDLLGSDWLAAAVAFGYLAHPAGGHAVAYEYRTLTFGPLFVLSTFALAVRGRWTWAWVTFGLLLLVREECGLTAAALGLCVAGGLREWRRGAVMVVVGLFWFGLCLTVLIPLFRDGVQSDTLARYAQFGATPSAIVSSLVEQPWLVLQHFQDDLRRVSFLPSLMMPWLLVGAASLSGLAATLLAGAPSVLSSEFGQYTWGWHYPLPVLPVCAIAAVLGLRNVRRRMSSQRLVVTLIVLMVGVTALANLQGVFIVDRWMVPYNDKRHEFEQVRPFIPDDASLSATGKLGAQFPNRRALAVYPTLEWPAEAFPQLPNRQADYVLVDHDDPLCRPPRCQPPDVMLDPAQYEIVTRAGQVSLFRRRGP